MSGASQKKNDQLGVSWNTATARLKKIILFSLLQELDRLNCCRCEKPIQTSDELSIDHKIRWLDNDPKLFWDLSNIGYAHLKCNMDHGRQFVPLKSPDGLRWCNTCKSFKDYSNFSKAKGHRLGLRYVCKDCIKESRQKFRRELG